MIKFLWWSPKFILMGALFLSILTMGCGSGTDSDHKDPSSSGKDFTGTWKVNEELSGCNDLSLKIDYTAEVIQEGTEAQLKIGDNVMPCNVFSDELSCTGKLQMGSGSYRDFEKIVFWFEEDKQLGGTATWMLYRTDNESCLGNSLFSINQEIPDATINYSGTYNIRETWDGCNKTGVIDYTISIKQTEQGANLFIDNRSLDCTVSESELNCTGERHYQNGTYDNFSEYILWFNDQGRLEGEGSWTYYNAEGEDCSGTSTFSLNGFNSDNSDEINFEGVYQFFLNRDDCNGYQAAEQAGSYVIFQNGTNATFTSAEDPAFSFDCQIIRGELHCSGETITMADSDATWEISQMTFSFDSRNDLTGQATGIVHETDGSQCPGTYYFSIISDVSSETASFAGTWNVNEILLGCTTSMNYNYPVEITENGSDVTITIRGEVFDCAIENNELICSGAFHGESSAYFQYSEYRLWFNENDLLDGIARWTFIEGDNPVCDGNSTISASSSVSGSRSFNEMPEMDMGQCILFKNLQYGAESLQK